MKRLVIITFVIAVFLLLLAYSKSKEYANYNMTIQGERQIKYIENKINENNNRLQKIKEEENNLKENNNEKVEILNVWKKMLEEIKTNI